MVAMLSLFLAINFADKSIVGLAAVPIMRDLNLTHEEFGKVGSAFFLLFPVTAILVGFIANRVSTKLIVALMACLWAVVQLPMVGSVSLTTLIICRGILGAGEGPAYPVGLHGVFKWFKNSERTFPAAVYGAGAYLGAGLAAPLFTWIIATYNWHIAFGVLGAIGFVWVIFWWIFGEDGPEPQAVAGGKIVSDERVPYRYLIFSRTTLGAMIASFSAYWALTLSIVWLPIFLMQGAGYTAKETGWIVLMPNFIQVGAAPVIGFISQRMLGRGYSSRAARGWLGTSIVMFSGACLIGLSRATGGVLEIALVLGSFSFGNAMYNLGATSIGEICPPSQRGAMLGINNAVWTSAGLVAPFVMGHTIDLGVNLVAGFRNGFTFAGILVVIGGAIGFILMNPEKDIARFARIRGLETAIKR
jgi:MFS family permease